MNEQKLNKKLAEWVGFTHYQTNSGWVWVYPNGETQNIELPNFTQSLDACLEWLAPKVTRDKKLFLIHFSYPSPDLWTVELGKGVHTTHGSLALALCLAIEKLIDSR